MNLLSKLTRSVRPWQENWAKHKKDCRTNSLGRRGRIQRARKLLGSEVIAQIYVSY